jgi:Electron transfer DM13
MKTTIQKLGMIICSFLFLSSCTKDEGQIVTPPDTTPISATSVLKFTGTIVNGPSYKGTGTVNIYLDKDVYTLKFDKAVVDNGPDLKVYLSKGLDAKDIVNLGGFSASTSSYAIPATANVADYKYVLIYCQQAGQLFVSASMTAK